MPDAMLSGEKRGRILVIDDEEGFRKSFVESLIERGHEAHEAIDCRDALDKIEHGGYDLVILDLKMPDMDGLELLKRIREVDEELIIFCITGYPSPESLKESLKQRCFDYITKPFDIDEVNSLIQRALDVRRMKQQRREEGPAEVQTPEELRSCDGDA